MLNPLFFQASKDKRAKLAALFTWGHFDCREKDNLSKLRDTIVRDVALKQHGLGAAGRNITLYHLYICIWFQAMLWGACGSGGGAGAVASSPGDPRSGLSSKGAEEVYTN